MRDTLNEYEAMALLGTLSHLDGQYRYFRIGEDTPAKQPILDAYFAIATFKAHVSFKFAQIMVQTLNKHFATTSYTLEHEGVLIFHNGVNIVILETEDVMVDFIFENGTTRTTKKGGK